MSALATSSSRQASIDYATLGSVAHVASACVQMLGPRSGWFPRRELSESLALCTIEAAQATCSGFTGVCSVIDRYQEYRRTKSPSDSPNRPDTLRNLLETFDDVGGPSIWAGKVGNFRRRYTGDGPAVCAAGIFHAADNFYRSGINTTADLTRAISDPRQRSVIGEAWQTGLGDPSTRSWQHLLALTGRSDSPLDEDAAEIFLAHIAINRGSIDSSALDSAAAVLDVTSATLRFTILRWYLSESAAGIKEPLLSLAHH